MLERVLSGIVLAIITISSLLIGGWYLFALCAAISMIGMFEFYRVLGLHKEIIGVIGYFAMILLYVCLAFARTDLVMPLLVLAMLAILVAYVVTFPKYKVEDAAFSFMGIVYVGMMLSYIYQTRMAANGIYIVWIIFICSWGSDTFAYFTGVLFGKHKMTPVLSPKKSIEGAVGGIVAAALLGAGYGWIVSEKLTIVHEPVIVFALACAIGAFFSIFGDLAASAIKRNRDIKDYGNLIPGHGGIMDRYDSVIVTAPVVFWLFTLLG